MKVPKMFAAKMVSPASSHNAEIGKTDHGQFGITLVGDHFARNAQRATQIDESQILRT